MSYILDALKRADAERGRGQVPGLNAQPLGGAQAAPPRSGARWGWLAAGAMGVLLAAAVAWWTLRPVPSGHGGRDAAGGAVAPAAPTQGCARSAATASRLCPRAPAPVAPPTPAAAPAPRATTLGCTVAPTASGDRTPR
jgi:general secretion pathway protein B